MPQIKTLLLLAQGGEDMEIFQPIDVLRKTNEVLVAGVLGPEQVRTASNVTVLPDMGIDEALAKGPFDLIILPGGLYGAPVLAASAKVGEAARKQLAEGRVLASICGGGWALMKHGVAKGSRITSFPYFRERMRELDVKHEWTIVDDERVVKHGKLISSQGPGTAAEFSFSIVEHFLGQARAEEVAKFFLYRPDVLPEETKDNKGDKKKSNQPQEQRSKSPFGSLLGL